jgi:hypothetical protein
VGPWVETHGLGVQTVSRRGRPVQRQAHGKRGSDADGAVHVDLPAVLVHDLVHAGQPQPEAADLGVHVAAPEETGEDARQVGGRDADPLIPHGEDRPVLAADLF